MEHSQQAIFSYLNFPPTVLSRPDLFYESINNERELRVLFLHVWVNTKENVSNYSKTIGFDVKTKQVTPTLHLIFYILYF